MNLYIYNYNNYYNRIFKKAGDSIYDYDEFLYYGPVKGVYGFTPGDGVNTTQLIGTNVRPYYDGKGDYLIVHNPNTNEIDSRWFIIDHNRTRDGQWQLILHRDLIADNYTDLLNEPMFIEKATVNKDDPAIWNGEGVAVNLIKKSEMLLHDKSNSAWIVGYIPRDYDGGKLHLSYSSPTADFTTASIDDFVNGLGTANIIDAYSLEFTMGLNYGNKRVDVLLQLSSKEPDKWVKYTTSVQSPFYYQLYKTDELPDEVLNATTNKSKLLEQAEDYIPAANQQLIDLLKSWDGKIVKSSTSGIYYKLKLNLKKGNRRAVLASTDKFTIDKIPSIPTYIKERFKTKIPASRVITSYDQFPKPTIYYEENTYSIDYEQYSFSSMEIDFPSKDKRNHLNDAPYDMFCVPYTILSDNEKRLLDLILITDVDNRGSTILINAPHKDEIISIVLSVAQQLSGNIIDLQLLPFCPLDSWSTEFVANYNIFTKYASNISTETDSQGNLVSASSKDFYYKRYNNTNFIMFFPTRSSGSFTIKLSEYDDALINELYNRNKKIANECEMFRLVSPNYNGQFEYNNAKNDGTHSFDVDYTYLPYSPYIHLNPDFKGLYGNDFNDCRGLIMQGDFSISYMSDAWVNYQVQNKNYANTFNRQIQNMELTQDVQRKQQIFNAVTGTVMGGAAGAVTGAKGGVAGIVAGAAVGTIASTVGGALDVAYGDLLRNEALDYTKDMYNYQLDNIKALPDNIQKITAYTLNNKIFPILEIYTCTPTELGAIANKIAYNGMTVMRIGTMSEFIGNLWSFGYTDENTNQTISITSKGYIKGKLIRLENVNESYRIINAISEELNKGVFIK